MPVVVTHLTEDVDTILAASMPSHIRASLRANGRDSWVGIEVDADEPLLVETFTNLIGKALAAMCQNDGNRFSVLVSSPFILQLAPGPAGTYRPVAPQRDDSHVTFTFTDTGRGMRPDRMQSLWCGQSTKGLEGNGLGLPHVAWVVRAHHGFIEVSSDVGRGTSITIGPPLRHERAPRTVVVNEPDRIEAPDVVVVDDNPSAADLLATLVQLSAKKKATPAYSGAEGLKAIIPGKRQIVFLDLSIPGEKPDATVRAIRAKNPDALIVILSGYSPADKHAELEKYTDGWWIKPADPGKMMDYLKDKLD
jgi:CheY-like chemotaxis protein